MGGCARLRWSAAGVRSVSSARIRCARALWAVSGRRPAPRPRGRRPRPAGLLASLSPPADRPGVPCLRRACRLQPAHLVAWRPLAAAAGAAGSLGRAPRNPSGIPEEVAVWAALASLAARRSPPGLLSLHRRFPTIVLPMFGARRRALAPIRHLRPADAGVCASHSGGGASDSKTLPEYSPRPACDGGEHCATAGTPTQHTAYACAV